MTDPHDPISEDEISIRDAFEILYRTVTQDARDYANREASRSHDQSRLRASEWLRVRLSQGILIALFWDPEKKKNQQISWQRWASMGTSLETLSDEQLFAIESGVSPADAEALSVFETSIIIVSGVTRTVFLNRKSFDDATRDIAPADDARAAHPGERVPTASKARSELQELIRDFYNQIYPGGYKGRVKERDDAIIREFKKQNRNPPSPKTIQRALKPD